MPNPSQLFVFKYLEDWVSTKMGSIAAIIISNNGAIDIIMEIIRSKICSPHATLHSDLEFLLVKVKKTKYILAIYVLTHRVHYLLE